MHNNKNVEEAEQELYDFLSYYAYQYAESDPIIKRTVEATRNVKTPIEEPPVITSHKEYVTEDGYYNVRTGETDLEEYID